MTSPKQRIAVVFAHEQVMQIELWTKSPKEVISCKN